MLHFDSVVDIFHVFASGGLWSFGITQTLIGVTLASNHVSWQSFWRKRTTDSFCLTLPFHIKHSNTREAITQKMH